MKVFYNNEEVYNIEHYILYKDFQQALYRAEKYVNDYPYDELGPMYLARCLANNGNKSEAYKLADQVINSKLRHPSSYVIAYTWYGLMCNEVGDTDKAIEYFKEAIKRESDGVSQVSLKSRLQLSNIFVQLKRPEEALECLDNVNIREMNGVYSKRSYIYLMMNKPNKALNELNKIDESTIEVPKIAQQVHLNKGKVYRKLGYYEEAEEQYKKVLTDNNNYYADALYELCYMYQDMYKTDESINYGLRLLNETTHTNDACVVLGKAYLRKGYLDESLYYINQINNKRQRDYYLSLINFSNGDFQAAIESSEYLLDKEEDEDRISSIFELLIMALIRLGKVDEASYKFNFLKDDIALPCKHLIRAYFNNYYNNKENFKTSFYSAEQLNDYSLDRAVDHIIRGHLSDEYEQFSSRENIIQLLKEIKEVIPVLTPRYEELFDKYIYVIDEETDKRIGVVTLPDSTDVLTMYPLDGSKLYNLDEEKTEIKKVSQIDKFNKRYGLK